MNNRRSWVVKNWDLIITAINGKKRFFSRYLYKIIDNYLKNRQIMNTQKEKMEDSQEVPHGSVVGVTLWNIIYVILHLDVGKEVRTIAYL